LTTPRASTAAAPISIHLPFVLYRRGACMRPSAALLPHLPSFSRRGAGCLVFLGLAALAVGPGRAAATPAVPGSAPALTTPAVPTEIDYGAELDKLIASRDKESASARLARLFDLAWRNALDDSPELASSLGVPGHDDRWSDASEAAFARRRALSAKTLAAIQSTAPGWPRRRRPRR
jgi:hypothetical protein